MGILFSLTQGIDSSTRYLNVSGCSESLQEAVEIWDDIVGVVAVDEALPTVVYEPAVDVWAVPLIVPVVLLPAPNTHTNTQEVMVKRNVFVQKSVLVELKPTWWRVACCPSHPWWPPSSEGRPLRACHTRSHQALWKTALRDHKHSQIQIYQLKRISVQLGCGTAGKVLSSYVVLIVSCVNKS